MSVKRFRHPAIATLAILLAQWSIYQPGWSAMAAQDRDRAAGAAASTAHEAPGGGPGDDALEPKAAGRSEPRARRLAPPRTPPAETSLAAAVGQYNGELERTAELLRDWRAAAARAGTRGQLESLLEATHAELDTAAGLLERKFERIRSALVRHGTPAQVAEFDEFLAEFRGEHRDVRQGVLTVATGAAGRAAAAETLLRRLERRPDRDPARGPAGQISRPLPSRPIVFDKDPPARESTITPAYRGGEQDLAGELDPTPDAQITQEIQDLADSLGNSALRIYEFVRDNTAFEPYFGSLKGSRATLETLAGNDYDLASLTIALLRASNIPSRYVRGTVKIPTQRAQDWLSVRDPDAVNRLLNSAGISAIGVDLGGNGSIDWFEVDRVWVEAQVPHANYRGVEGSGGGAVWIPLDPAFKLRQHQPGIPGIPSQVPFDEGGYFAARTGLLAYEWYRNQVRDWLATNMPEADIGDVAYSGTIVPEPLGVLPASLPHEELAFTAEWVEIPDILRHRFQVTLLDQFAGTVLDRPGLRTVETSLSRLTVSYAASSDFGDIAESLGGLGEVPGFLATLTPELKLDGVVDTVGTTVNSGDPINVRVRYFFPDDSPIEEVTHPRSAGDYHALIFDSHQVSDTLLDRRGSILIGANADVGTPSEDPDALQGELLNLTGLRYWQRVAQGDRAIGDLFQFRSVKQWFEILATADTSVQYLYDRPFAVTPGNLGVDSQRQSKSQVGIDGDQTSSVDVFKLEGRNGSAQEHAVWEEIVHVDSVSTIKALQFANETDINGDAIPNNGDVLDLTIPGQTSLLCPGFPANAKNSMEAALSAGQVVKTPYCDFVMNQWHGVGWIEEDPATGAGAYLISGFLAGGETTVVPTAAGENWLPLGPAGFDDVVECAHAAGVPVLTLVDPRDVAALDVSIDDRRRIREELLAGREVQALQRAVDCAGERVHAYRVEDGRAWRRAVSRGGAGTENPPGNVPNPYENGPPGDCSASGQPVTLFNGNMYHRFEDFAVRGLGPRIVFARTYNSQRDRLGPMGYGWSHSYDVFLTEDPGISATVTNGSGNEIFFVDNGDGSYTSPPGVHETLETIAGGWRMTAVSGDVWEFDSAGKATLQRDASGNTVALAYDGSNRLSSVTDPLSRSITLTYGADDLIDTVADWTGRTWTFDHDADGDLISSTTPGDVNTPAETTTYTYYDVPYLLHDLHMVLMPESTSLEFEYYANDKLFRHTESGLRATTYLYQPLRGLTTIVDSRGFEKRFFFDANSQLIAVEEPDGAITRFAYDGDGNMTQRVDPAGYVTDYTWDSSGRLLTATDARSGVKTLTYATTFPVMSSIQDRTMALSLQTVDPSTGLVSGTQDAEGGTQSFLYDPQGRMTSLTDERGKTTTFSYDPASGRLSQISDPLGIVTQYTYDALGRIKTGTDPESNVTQFDYDILGRLIRITDELNRFHEYSYDGLGRVTGWTRPDSSSVGYTYDALGNRTSETDPLGRTTTFSWTQSGCGCPTEGLVTSIATPDGGTWSYAYDGVGRMTEIVDPLGRSTRMSYESRGRMSERVEPNGNRVTYAYDELGRLAQIQSDLGDTVSFTYDAEGRYLTASNSTTTYTYTYSPNGWRETVQDSLTGKTLTYDYDPAGFLTTLTDGEGLATIYTYDDARRLSQIEDFENEIYTFSADLDRRVTGIAYPNGQSATYVYDPVGSLLSLDVSGASGTAVSQTFTYDAMNRAMTEANSIEGPSSFAYDTVGRLLDADRSGRPDETFAYDVADNRIADASGLPLLYDPANSLIRRGAERFAYDERGNLVERSSPAGTTSYQYDWNNRLVRVDLPGGSVVQYRYDPFGLLVERDEDGAVIRLLRDRDEVLARYDGSNTLTAKYVRGVTEGKALAVTIGGTRSYLHQDQRLSTVAVTDSTGAIVARQTFDSWGNLVARQGTWSDPVLYTGRDFDDATGLYYLHSRHYDPLTGRFLQRDPLGLSGGLNLYGYVGQNPIGFVDLNGEWLTLVTGLIGAAVGAAIGAGIAAYTGGDWRQGAIQGAIAGGVSGLTLGLAGPAVAGLFGTHAMLGGAAAGALASGLGDAAAQGYAIWTGAQCQFDFGRLGLSAALGGAFGGFSLRPGTLPNQQVTSWGPRGVTPDLNTGRWVMTGGPTPRNFLHSLPHSNSYGNPITGTISSQNLSWPPGWEVIKGFVGQRVIVP